MVSFKLAASKYNSIILSSLLFLLLFSVIGGAVLLNFELLGIQVYAFRIVLACGLIYLAATGQLVLYRSPLSKYAAIVLLIWLVYGIISLSWCPDVSAGVKELIYIAIGTGLYFFLFSLTKALPDILKKLETYWGILFLVTLVFSINEILTQHHLTGSFTDNIRQYGELHSINKTPVFTFDNPNHFAVYLCLTITLSLYFLLKNSRTFLAHFLIIGSAFLLLIYTESRLALMLMIIMALIVTVFHYKRIIKAFLKIKVILAFVLVMPAIYALHHFTHPKPDFASPGDILISRVDSPGQDDLSNAVFLVEHNTAQKLLDGKQVKVVYHEQKAASDNFMLPGKWADLGLPLFFMVGILVLLIVFLLVKFRASFRVPLVILAVSTGTLLAGVYLVHPFVRVNKKWVNYVLQEEGTPRLSPDYRSWNYTMSVGGALAADFKSEGTAKMVKAGERPIDVSQSDQSRKQLIVNGLHYLKESDFLGTGAGGYTIIAEQRKSFGSHDMVNPHNLIIEILAQYGIIIFLLVAFIFIRVLSVLFLKWKYSRWSAECTFTLLLVANFVMMSNANSSSLPLPIIWLIFTAIICYTDKLLQSESQDGSKN